MQQSLGQTPSSFGNADGTGLSHCPTRNGNFPANLPPSSGLLCCLMYFSAIHQQLLWSGLTFHIGLLPLSWDGARCQSVGTASRTSPTLAGGILVCSLATLLWPQFPLCGMGVRMQSREAGSCSAEG